MNALWSTLSIKVREYIPQWSTENTKYDKPIIFLGRGWFYKGFIEHIDPRFRIKTISSMSLDVSKDHLENRVSIPKLWLSDKYNEHLIDDVVQIIDLENSMIVGKKKSYSFSEATLICGIGGNGSQKSWANRLYDIDNMNPRKVSIVGAGPIGTETAFNLNDKGWHVILYDMVTPYKSLPERVQYCIFSRLSDQDITLLSNTKFDAKDNIHLGKHIFYAFNPVYNNVTKLWHQTNTLNAKIVTSETSTVYPNVYFGGDSVYYPHSDVNNPDIPMRTAQNAYDQGKYLAHRLNTGEDESYVAKPKFRTLYVGKGMDLVYRDGINAYILIPHILVEFYHKAMYKQSGSGGDPMF